MKKLFHCSSFHFNLNVGDSVVLHPGTQCAQGRGVYFSEGEPDERASDSCYEAGESRTIFVLDVEASTSRGWWRSKPSMDKRKGRPPTWHSGGADILVCVTGVHGKTVYGTATRV